MNHMNKKVNEGFTLIEVLIVVSIVGLLASVVLVGLGGFRAKGQDARRIADLRQTQNALELYYSKNSNYPVSSVWSVLSDTLEGEGIGVSKIPADPTRLEDDADAYKYSPNTSRQGYTLRATLDPGDAALNNDIDGSSVNTINCGSVGDTEGYYCIQF